MVNGITTIAQVADIKNSKYEWNVLVSPYSKMRRNFDCIGTSIILTNVQFNEGDLALLNHSISLILNAGSKTAYISFKLDSNSQCVQSEFLAIGGDVVKDTIPFTLTKGTYDSANDQWPWTASIVNANWNEAVDVLRFVFNIDHHPRHIVKNFQDASTPSITDGVELDVDRFFLSNKLSDITFVCEEQEFLAHRYALACKSTVFEKMFLANMKENVENCVVINDMDKKSFKEFLNFFYSGKIDESKSDIAIPLLVAADKYDVPQLKELCVKLLLRNLNPKNSLEIYSAAEMHNATILKNRAMDVIKRNKHASVADKEALQYYINKHPDLMFELFKM